MMSSKSRLCGVWKKPCHVLNLLWICFWNFHRIRANSVFWISKDRGQILSASDIPSSEHFQQEINQNHHNRTPYLQLDRRGGEGGGGRDGHGDRIHLNRTRPQRKEKGKSNCCKWINQNGDGWQAEWSVPEKEERTRKAFRAFTRRKGETAGQDWFDFAQSHFGVR